MSKQSKLISEIMEEVSSKKIDLPTAMDRVKEIFEVTNPKPVQSVSLDPQDRFNLPFANMSDYVLANYFFMLGRDEHFKVMGAKHAVIDRLNFLGTHLNIVNDPRTDIRPYAALNAEQFAEWIAKGDSDPFDGRNDDPEEIHRTARGNMGLVSFIDWVAKSQPSDLNFISVQTAVKERMRYYSRQLYLTIQRRLSELDVNNESSEEVSGS